MSLPITDEESEYTIDVLPVPEYDPDDSSQSMSIFMSL
jgi:hypothetical protein